MSLIPSDPKLKAIESALGELIPVSSRLDRDQLMFQAGALSGALRIAGPLGLAFDCGDAGNCPGIRVTVPRRSTRSADRRSNRCGSRTSAGGGITAGRGSVLAGARGERSDPVTGTGERPDPEFVNRRGTFRSNLGRRFGPSAPSGPRAPVRARCVARACSAPITFRWSGRSGRHSIRNGRFAAPARAEETSLPWRSLMIRAPVVLTGLVVTVRGCDGVGSFRRS